MGPQALLELVEKIFKRFNPAQVTLDTHVDKSIAEMQVTNPHVSLESHGIWTAKKQLAFAIL